MDSLAISTRPKTWDEVVGQERAIHILRDILTKGRFRPRGVIYEGPHGVGKTSSAYVTAKALMCTGDVKDGCGRCPSCLLFQDSPEAHPDFKEMDAASNSGVEAARRIVEEAIEIPTLGRTRVILIDEVQRLSREAWDVYLKPLEQAKSRYVFLFATTDASRIPKTIKSRCCTIPFLRVATDTIVGLLSSLAVKNKIDYEMEGVRLIARGARGSIRDALTMLDKAAAMGKVTKARVGVVVDTTYPGLALDVLVHSALDRLPKAIEVLDEMARLRTPSKAIEEVFSAYGRCVFGDPDLTEEEAKRYEAVRGRFPSPAIVTPILIKWSSTDRIPADALPLFAYELTEISKPDAAPSVKAPRAKTTVSVPQPEESTPSGGSLSQREIASMLGATITPVTKRT